MVTVALVALAGLGIFSSSAPPAIQESVTRDLGVPTSSLSILVTDPSGAVIPHAGVQLFRIDQAREVEATVVRAGDGRWLGAGLSAGVYEVRVEAAGFVSRRTDRVRLRRGDARALTVRLALAPLEASLEVGVDAQTAALDPRGFSTVLSAAQIETLPDDPEQMVRALRDMAPPGAILRIDGFDGAVLPPKSQILSIRIPRIDTFAAQDHGGLSGLSVIEVVTRPGGGRFQGSLDASGRSAGMSAREPLATTRTAATFWGAGVALDGPIAGRISFAAAVRTVARRDAATVHAAQADGPTHHEVVTQPVAALTLSGRVTAGLPGERTLRLSVATDQRTARHLGVGDLNLSSRGYDVGSFEHVVRVAAGGRWGRHALIESRAQLRWSGIRHESALEAPTIRVLDAFTTGGAQVTGGGRAFETQWATDVDYARGAHAWRTGVLVDTGRYAANRRANYLGTFTFASMDAYASGTPALFTRRFGDARVRYADLQTGAYVQDDYRVTRSLLLSYGVRYEWQRLVPGDHVWLPRAALAWSPRLRGGTTVRVGWGHFSDWLAAGVYEQSLVVDGHRQWDVRVVSPSYPDPGATGMIAARERYALDERLALPNARALSLSLEHQLAATWRLLATLGTRSGAGLLRGRNLNPLIDGRRLDEAFGNVIVATGDARSRARTMTVQSLYWSPRRAVDLSWIYAFTHAETNTSGAFAPPAQGDDLEAEWGPSGPTHVMTGSLTARVSACAVTVAPRWRSGTPYSITIGDRNGDGFFTDRPRGMRRNAAVTPHQWEVAARLAYALAFGSMPSPPAPAGAGDQGERRVRLEVYTNVHNVFNRPNYLAIGGVIGAPFFGKPLAAASPRTVDVGVRLTF